MWCTTPEYNSKITFTFKSCLKFKKNMNKNLKIKSAEG